MCLCMCVYYLNCGCFQNLSFDYTLAISLDCSQTLRNEVVSCPDHLGMRLEMMTVVLLSVLPVAQGTVPGGVGPEADSVLLTSSHG